MKCVPQMHMKITTVFYSTLKRLDPTNYHMAVTLTRINRCQSLGGGGAFRFPTIPNIDGLRLWADNSGFVQVAILIRLDGN